jgi:hypothetical protein
MTSVELKTILADHALWLRGKGGKRADLRGADLFKADLSGANLREAYLREAYLFKADLSGANLREANLREANLREANLSGAELSGANLRGANLLCQGNMRELRTMQIDTWPLGYTADTLQIGCQRHPIEKWRKWNTDAGREWIAKMDGQALAWADRNLSLVLAMIDANPATWTGHEAKAEEVAA